MKKRRGGRRAFPWGGVLFAALALCVPALFLRACSLYGEADGGGTDTGAAAPLPILVYHDETGRTERMDMEVYLCGVVAAECPASFAQEALKAQAVAARTYAKRRLGKPCGRGGAEICTDSACCQAYAEEAACREKWGSDYGKYWRKIQSAVEETAGEAIYYEGELIEALYHASSGGRTEDAQHVFAQARPYLVGVESPGEEDAGVFYDEKAFSRRELVKRVNRACAGADLEAARLEEQLRVLSRYESGRVEEVALGGARLSGKELRKLLGLRSANFSIAYEGDSVLFSTRGYGHGVGMSQYGANAMAREGADYREILSYYYAGVEIR